METKGASALHIDDIETVAENKHVVGSTKLINGDEVVLVPTPTNDPNGKIPPIPDCISRSFLVLT
jgi:hypothetical protein